MQSGWWPWTFLSNLLHPLPVNTISIKNNDNWKIIKIIKKHLLIMFQKTEIVGGCSVFPAPCRIGFGRKFRPKLRVRKVNVSTMRWAAELRTCWLIKTENDLLNKSDEQRTTASWRDVEYPLVSVQCTLKTQLIHPTGLEFSTLCPIRILQLPKFVQPIEHWQQRTNGKIASCRMHANKLDHFLYTKQ